MKTLTEIKDDALKCASQEEFSKYLESYFFEIESYFGNLTISELNELKFDIEDFLYDLLDASLIKKTNPQIINAFLLLLAKILEQANLLGIITVLFDSLPESKTKNRLAAAQLYLKVNDITKDYHNRFEEIIALLEIDTEEDDISPNIRAVEKFFMTALGHFSRINDEELVKSFKELFKQYRNQYNILKIQEIVNLVEQVSIDNYEQYLKQIEEKSIIKNTEKTCILHTDNIQKEESEYGKKLYAISNPNFQAIRQVCYNYIQSIGDLPELYEQLMRGEKIIDDERLLYKYMVSFGQKHKEKLYDSYEMIIDLIKSEKINIIDWGCGQALATVALLDFAREKDIVLDISDIRLIEPSKIALERGLLHIDVLKQKEYAIKAINTDFDCIEDADLKFDNDYKTLHLFSNILDMENFKLNDKFLKKISSTFKNDNLFVCVSPNINAQRNNRLDLFYNYFDENFDTRLISARDSDVNNKHKRYEKVFEVKYIEENIIEEKRKELQVTQKEYHLNVIQELERYSKYIAPILNIQVLENSINSDPEYVIYKIRKVSEVVTSKIYSQYELNGKTVSFNDKIRYLAYEKKVFDKTITNYIQTLRTIGNRGVHEDGRDISKLKLDAHLMIIALVSFLNEIIDKKLL